MKWPNGPKRSLGIHVGHNKDECYKLNWTSKLDNIKQLADRWSHRNLTLIGKIYIVKSELLSKIIYTATILPIPEDIVSKINKILYKFLWGKTEKVKRKIINNDFDNGGLKMIDLESQFMAIKAAWIPRFLRDNQSNAPWTILAKFYFDRFGDNNAILRMNVYQPDSLPELKRIPKFYQEVIISFNKSKCLSKPTNQNELLNSPIWGNRFFTYHIKKKTFVLNNLNWQKAGLILVKDVKITDSKIDQNYIYRKVKVKSKIFHQMKTFLLAMKPYIYLIENNNPLNPSTWLSVPYFSNNSVTIDITLKKSSFFYSNFVNHNISQPVSEIFWTRLFYNSTILFDRCYISRIKQIKIIN